MTLSELTFLFNVPCVQTEKTESSETIFFLRNTRETLYFLVFT